VHAILVMLSAWCSVYCTIMFCLVNDGVLCPCCMPFVEFEDFSLLPFYFTTKFILSLYSSFA
jgi:hypothetical protein